VCFDDCACRIRWHTHFEICACIFSKNHRSLKPRTVYERSTCVCFGHRKCNYLCLLGLEPPCYFWTNPIGVTGRLSQLSKLMWILLEAEWGFATRSGFCSFDSTRSIFDNRTSNNVKFSLSVNLALHNWKHTIADEHNPHRFANWTQITRNTNKLQVNLSS